MISPATGHRRSLSHSWICCGHSGGLCDHDRCWFSPRPRDIGGTRVLVREYASAVVHDPRSGGSEATHMVCGRPGTVGWFIHGYESAWLPAGLLDESRMGQLNEMLFVASGSGLSPALQQGLAGAPADALAAARETAMNPR